MQASAYTAAFKAAGRVSLASDGSQKSFVLGRVVVQPTLSVKTAPSVDPTAYVEAHFVDAGGRADPARPGGADRATALSSAKAASVSSRPATASISASAATTRSRSTARRSNRKENEPTWYNQTKIETREFVTTVKNLHAFPVKVQVIDRAPVSENAAIVVELAPADHRRRPTSRSATSAG